MQDKDSIKAIIAKHYPSMQTKFESLFPTINFDDHLISQLAWAENQREVERGLHRLHCLVGIFSGELQTAYSARFAALPAFKKQALIALVLIDSCKGVQSAIDAFKAAGHAELNDGVPFFFDTLSKQPDIYPIFQNISPVAQAWIKDNIFYLHQRHIQLGEVPPSSLNEFKALFPEENEKLHARLELQNLFWLANSMGFNVPGEAVAVRESVGPTMSDEWFQTSLHVQATFAECIEKKNLQPLNALYTEQLPAEIRDQINQQIPAESDQALVQVFLGRLKMLFDDRIKGDGNASKLIEQLAQEPQLLLRYAKTEQACFDKVDLQAVTFAPPVLQKCVALAAEGGKSLMDGVKAYLNFLDQLFQQIQRPEIVADLRENRSFPLIFLDKNEKFLRAVLDNPEHVLELSVTIDRFVKPSFNWVAPAPKMAAAAASSMKKVLNPNPNPDEEPSPAAAAAANVTQKEVAKTYPKGLGPFGASS